MCCKFPTVLLWFHTKSLDQTSLAWHEYSDHLWCLGVIKRLWWRRLISVWLKLAELPYLASSRRKRKEAVKRLAKRQRYHMITTADGYTSHLFFCARSLSGDMWKLHLYTVLSAGNCFCQWSQTMDIRSISRMMWLLSPFLLRSYLSHYG